MQNEFEIGNVKFKLRKINAFKQFHIVRRVGPLLAEMLPAMKQIMKAKDDNDLSEDKKFDKFAEIAAPIMTGLSKLTDEDADKVLNGLLSAVEMQQSAGNWASIVVNDMMMIQNLELPVMLQLAGRSFMFNIAGFFPAAQAPK